MGFADAIKSCLNQYVGFSGRAPRSEFWFFQLFLLLVNIVTSVLDGVLGTGGILLGIASLGLLLPNLAVTFRRLHDTDRRGWWILIALIPLVGAIVLLVFMVLRGTEGDNRFGSDPLQGGGAAAPAAPAEP